jgi:hypothetical protein
MIISRITAFEAFQCDFSTARSSFADRLATVEIENDYATIQRSLSTIRQNASELQDFSDSMN